MNRPDFVTLYNIKNLQLFFFLQAISLLPSLSHHDYQSPTTTTIGGGRSNHPNSHNDGLVVLN
jgi:hypothetical protein